MWVTVDGVKTAAVLTDWQCRGEGWWAQVSFHVEGKQVQSWVPSQQMELITAPRETPGVTRDMRGSEVMYEVTPFSASGITKYQIHHTPKGTQIDVLETQKSSPAPDELLGEVARVYSSFDAAASALSKLSWPFAQARDAAS